MQCAVNQSCAKSIGAERRTRVPMHRDVSQLAWRGGGCFDSRRRVNSNVRRRAKTAQLITFKEIPHDLRTYSRNTRKTSVATGSHSQMDCGLTAVVSRACDCPRAKRCEQL